ncbi:putative baseplate assembly protein [Leptolyngbya sp. FACHB-321]|uniref:putative baseplate assembly protein n=1 Tax=Leptolyngbya sp. FACHB-321 TaxID=2692807 RepID=UPI00168909D2|nr:putative baseplate assembly protein [Leptolyngbya sp. FACHB-321]
MRNADLPQHRPNSPGLTALAYRISDYTSTKHRILESLYQVIPPGSATLAALRTRDENDTVIALIDAWAMVIDVLTFYQERIANEGYWRTATERRSLLELARTIGCELQPGVAASTYLTFNVESTPTAPAQVTIPAGTQIASIPGENEQSQVFETSEPLIARADWNLLKPRLMRPQILSPQTQCLYLQGLNLRLQVGDRVLLIDEPLPGETLEDNWYLLTLTAVDLLSATGQTRITWEPQPTPLVALRQPRLLAFRQQVFLFGNLAPRWETLPADVKQQYSPILGGCLHFTKGEWRSVSLGLPTIDLRCLASSNSCLLVGTLGSGIYRSLNRGASWQQVTIGLSNLAIETLYCTDQRHIFAGTPGGGVFRSRDEGETWAAIGTGSVRMQTTEPNRVQSVNTALPNTVVRCLLMDTVTSPLGSGTISSGENNTICGIQTQFRTELSVGESITINEQTRQICEINSDTELKITHPFEPAVRDAQFTTPERTFLFAGTDDGVYRSTNQGQDWYSHGLAARSIRALLLLSPFLYAATDQGVYGFSIRHYSGQWELLNPNFTQSITCLASLRLNPGQANEQIYLFAGTASDGVYRLSDVSNTWERQWSPSQLDITALAANGTTLYAGTGSGKVFVSQDGGESWQDLSQNAIATAITALSVVQDDLFVSTRFGGFVNADWSRSGQPVTNTVPTTSESTLVPPTCHLNLNAIYPQILPHSWVVLSNQGQVQPLQVQTLSTALATGFTLSTQVTCLTCQSAYNPVSYPPQTTIVLAHSEPLPLADISLTLENQQQQIDTAIANPNLAMPSALSQSECFQDPVGVDRIYLEQFVQGLQPGQKIIVSGQHPRVEIIQVGGVFRQNPSQDIWQPDNQGLTNLAVLSLLTIFSGEALAGTISSEETETFAGTTRGLFRRQSSSQRWQQIEDSNQLGSGILADRQITVLHANSSGRLFAGTNQGLVRSSDQGDTWHSLDKKLPPSPIYALASSSRFLFIASRDGLFRSDDDGDTWTAINRDLLNLQVQCLAVNNQGYLFAGTLRHGVFRSQDLGSTWKQVGYSGKTGTGAIASTKTIVLGTGTVFSEELKSGDLLIALGQTRTVLVLGPDRLNNQLTIDAPFDAPGLPDGTPFVLSTGLTNLNVTALATAHCSGTGTISSDSRTVHGKGTNFLQELNIGDVIAVGDQSRVVIAIESKETCIVASSFAWTIVNQPFTKSLLFAGTAGGGVFRSASNGDRWQAVNQGLADLMITSLVIYEKLGGTVSFPGPNTTLTATSKLNLQVGARITIADQTRTVTAILDEDATFSIDKAFELQSPEQQETSYTVQTLVVGTEHGGLFYSLNQGEHWLVDGGLFYSLDQGEHWLADQSGLGNTAIRAIAPPLQPQSPCLVGGVGILLSPDGLEHVPLAPGDQLQVLTPPEVPRLLVTALRWHLQDVNGFVGVLTTTTAAAVTLKPALRSDQVSSELATILMPPTDQQAPLLVVQSPLQSCYDPATVQIHANVVAATQGETIAERPEVLGSGDGTQPNQRFFLKKPPLTYTSTATVTGIASSLEVRVNSLLWQPVPALYNLQPTDQVYLVQIEDDGSTSITFGDGINGARLPSGLDNVVATYRSGIGITGNLAPGKLSLLKTRPLGIQAVTNLLPATGAANPESRDEIRDRAPLTVRTLERVISLRDVEDFTRTFPGIGKAQAVSLWVTHSAIIHVTIAGSDGAEISPDSALYQNLVQAIEQVRDPYQSPPLVTSYQQIGFDLAATLLIDARYLPERVEATVQEKLQQTFAFTNREFGQPVTAAEVIALIQTIDGVIAVDLDFLYRVTASKTLEQCLTAKLAQWHPDTQKFSPAQLLTLHNASLTAHLSDSGLSNPGQVSNP